ncbi:DUF4271 domain-containing protein [Desertivirga brevis]|uniref:DUF4271 domain-containing protein n=1 Tax=Desertivirga brevis TaxID=2810310 RepID=UPI001A96204E|nr:DUF4271 domain-containing protein [Pedobacter sp. SYSU D00873]
MLFKKVIVLFLLIVLSVIKGSAQTDSLQRTSDQAPQATSGRRFVFRDSAYLARWLERKDSIRRVEDSIRAVGDSLAMVNIKRPDPERPNRFVDSLLKVYLVKDFNFQEWASRFPKKVQKYDEGKLKKKGDLWVIGFLFILLVLFAILKSRFTKESTSLIHAFYSNRILGQINKEEQFFSSWPFVFLYLLFGFIIGMFLYQCCRYYQLSYDYVGVHWFLRLSIIVIAFYTLKVLLIKCLGFVFKGEKIASEYISILFLTYFNAGLLFLPVVIALSLTAGRFGIIYIYVSLILLILIYFFQFLRAITNILSSYKFPLIYLFIYLCALEICPLLVLIKALRF